MAEGTWTQTFPSLVEHTKATGGSINTRVEGLGSNYNLLPAPHDDGKKGFFGPCHVGAATELGHAGSAGDIRNGVITHGTESGVADAYVVTMAIPATSYVAGMKINFVAGNTNTGASTINIDGLGVVSLKLSTSIELSADYIYAGDIVEAVFTGTYFQVTSISGNTANAATSADEAAASADEAAASAVVSSEKADDAAISAEAAASSANFIGSWADQSGAHVIPTSVYHSGYIWNLIVDVSDITLSEPGVSTDWVRVGGRSLVGELFMWPLDTPPSYGLLCNGGTHAYDDYPSLGSLMGGSPGGNFNVPDIPSFVKNSRGVDTGTDETESVGTHGHAADAVADHGHTVSVNAVGNHTHSVSASSYVNVSYASPTTTVSNDAGSSTGAAGGHSHTASAGAGGGHTPVVQDHTGVNQPACTLVNFCIRIE